MTSRIVLALALALVAACGSKKNDNAAPAQGSAASQPAAPAGSAPAAPPAPTPATPPSTPATVEVPTSTDFEDRAKSSITENNLSSQLDTLEKDVGQ